MVLADVLIRLSVGDAVDLVVPVFPVLTLPGRGGGILGGCWAIVGAGGGCRT